MFPWGSRSKTENWPRWASSQGVGSQDLVYQVCALHSMLPSAENKIALTKQKQMGSEGTGGPSHLQGMVASQ